MKREEPVLKALLGEPAGDVIGDFVEAAAAGGDAKFVKKWIMGERIWVF